MELKTYQIKIINKTSGYDSFYDCLKRLGAFFIYPNTFVLASIKSFKSVKTAIYKALTTDDEIIILEIKRELIEELIENKNAIEWLRQEYFTYLLKQQRTEYDNKLLEMHNVLVVAEQELQKLLENKKNKKGATIEYAEQ